mmetsp:Transcript_27874/g.67816  ORF Transcript_27874/g.67816 Transcript_27874/m.67816 type:complete len:458 (+) Transcript_27874:282-1655(+)|eukprot:CAMPEP_0113634032 /NCGR_PEP_ID=MMETSP0017_2-20120614/17718_1 /TAXON_ID=2856 /ORGANISM="Cylindrotheca closterium" /LENGTH=457 /DNA_ID=CAMNT_0000544709 /DNA_START=134 /DNA_END=1507 /DNA_ORIENTATION=- /assembly_acc=CAM_ASM_000147
MCNATATAIAILDNDNKTKTTISNNSNSDTAMPIVEEDKPKGPFAEYASEQVLSRLGEFQESVDSAYRKSLPQDKLAMKNQEQQPQQTTPDDSLHATGIDWKDVSIENVLGEGGFSFIFKVKLENPQPQNDDDDQPQKQKQNNEFALKCLKAKAIANEDDLEFNAMDLYTESYLLSHLNHDHIIGIHGVMDASLPDSYLTDGYFILLDIMETTLFDALEVWRESLSSPSKSSLKSKAAISVRIQNVMNPVVEAMQYLHQHDIVLRDLKPENIGFDQHGKVKLFDFGLARHISVLHNGDIAGSICYMAPEVMRKESVNFSCDVYSFAIVLWELCTLQVPLAEFEDMEEVERRVAKGNWRPSTTWIPSKTLRGLIKDCWNRDPKARPDFVSIEKTLAKCCNKENNTNQASDGKGKMSGLKRRGSKTANSVTPSVSFSDLYSEVLKKSPRRVGRQMSAPY